MMVCATGPGIVDEIQVNHRIKVMIAEDLFTPFPTNIDAMNLNVFGCPAKGSPIDADNGVLAVQTPTKKASKASPRFSKRLPKVPNGLPFLKMQKSCIVLECFSVGLPPPPQARQLA